MKIIFETPKTIKENSNFTFCSGCDHGIAIKLVAQIIDELNIKEETIVVSSSGCSVTLYDFLDIDCIEAPHGRACAAATGIKRAFRAQNQEKIVFTYQGDGDLASIGFNETLHSALRGENITAICINNTNYGMTGGQMGPTTTMGQITPTSPMGRNKEYHGFPIKAAEHIALCDGTCFSARVALFDVKNILKTKNTIKKAFEYQKEKIGFSYVEILASCPTNWKLSPQDSHKKIENEIIKTYPLGVFKDIKNE